MTPCFSGTICDNKNDNQIVVNKSDVKAINQIFLEHRTMSQQIPLLEGKINTLNTINRNLSVIDSLRKRELKQTIVTRDSLRMEDNKKFAKIIELKKTNKIQKKTIFGLSISTVTLAAFLIF